MPIMQLQASNDHAKYLQPHYVTLHYVQHCYYELGLRRFFAVGQFTVKKCQFRLGQVRSNNVRSGWVRFGSVFLFVFSFFTVNFPYGELSYCEKSQSLVCYILCIVGKQMDNIWPNSYISKFNISTGFELTAPYVSYSNLFGQIKKLASDKHQLIRNKL